MTISTTNVRNDYVGNGVAVTYPYTFKAFTAADLMVYVDGVLQTITTHYSVTGVGANAGGNVVFVTAPADDIPIAIVASMTLTQTTNLVNETRFFQSRIEDRLDKLCRADQIARSGLIATLRPGDGLVQWTSGSGTPEGVVTARIGSLFTRTDGGASTTLYVKESGTGNTGWVASGSAGSYGGSGNSERLWSFYGGSEVAGPGVGGTPEKIAPIGGGSTGSQTITPDDWVVGRRFVITARGRIAASASVDMLLLYGSTTIGTVTGLGAPSVFTVQFTIVPTSIGAAGEYSTNGLFMSNNIIKAVGLPSFSPDPLPTLDMTVAGDLSLWATWGTANGANKARVDSMEIVADPL